MLATLSVACSGGTDATSADSTSTAPSTTEATVASTTTAPEPQTTLEVTTTTEPESATGVIVASGGVLGWFGDGAWQPADAAAAVPDTEGRVFRVVGVTGEIGTAVGSMARPGCEMIEEHVDLDLDPSPYGAFDPFSGKPIAIDANWDVTPRAVVGLPLDSEVYAEIMSDHLALRGFEDSDPQIVQLYRVDLEGDGADEVIIVADNHGAEFFQRGVYSIMLVRKVIEGEVQTAVLHESIVPNDLGEDEFSVSVVARLSAVADLDGDGDMELALDSAYYEGAGTAVWDYVDDDLGFVSVLITGCGA